MTALADLSQAMANVVETASPSIVRVEGRKRMPATGVVWSADGVIVTASHVVQREENIRISLGGEETHDASFVGRDQTTDLAVLRVNGASLSAANWTNPDQLKVGNLVLALGRPGDTVMATLGVVSAMSEGWRTPAGGKLQHYLQTDVVMYPGFSGGPLVSADGQVFGVNSSTILRGISLTVPTTDISRVVEALLKHGKVRRGYLGIASQPVRLPADLEETFGQETGLLIVAVEAGTPAGQAGLLIGDILVAMNGQPVRVPDELLAMLTPDTVGATVPLTVVRGGQQQEIQVTIGERE